jgi:hypothetical protein
MVGAQVKPDFVNSLTVFVVSVLAVFEYFSGFPHNALMVESDHNIVAFYKEIMNGCTFTCPPDIVEGCQVIWLEAVVEYMLLCLPSLNQTKTWCCVTALCSQQLPYV